MSVGAIYGGKYFLLKKLAAGGMGEVFLARQQGVGGFEKILVIKRILSHLTDNNEYVEAFLTEARLQARMGHSSIAQIFDLGQAEDGSFYLAMEFIHGKSLVETITRCRNMKKPMPPELVAQVLERAADGLSYAHNLTDNAGRSMNIIHRDISPHNVLISYTGETKLIDFGIAKSEINSVKTETGTIKGKFFYMSPEQSAAKPLDKRSDIFSLGIVLYECLTGENPFMRQNVVLSLEAIQKWDPPPPSSVDPALAPFDAIVARALAKDREQRYQDAADMKDDLARVRLSGELPQSMERLGPFMMRIFREKYEAETRILQDTDSASVHALGTANVRQPTPPPARISTNRRRAPAVAQAQAAGAEGDGDLLDSTMPPRRSAHPPRRATGHMRAAQLDGDPTLPPRYPAYRRDLSDPGADEEFGPTALRDSAPPSRRRHTTATPRPAPQGQYAFDEDDDDAVTVAQSPAMGAHPAPAIDADPTAQSIPAPPKKSGGARAMLMLVLLAAAGAGGWYFLAGPGKGTLPISVAALGELVAEPPPAAPPEPIPLAPEEPVAAGPTAVVADPAPEQAVDGDLEEEKRKAEEEMRRAQELARAEEERREAEARKAADARRRAEAAKRPRREEKKAATEVKLAAAGKSREAKSEPASVKSYGSLLVRARPAASLRYQGRKVAGAKVELTSPTGSIQVGGAGSPFQVDLGYDAQSLTVNSEPWAIVYVNGVSKGKTPVRGLKLSEGKVSMALKTPGVEQALELTVLYVKPQ